MVVLLELFWILKRIQKELSRRKPGQSSIVTQRKEDEVQFLSGIFEGKTTGTPISFIILIPIKSQMIILI